jgi:pyruvate dehydrogenase E2 component (dihydrolipoamide acetyltransferase)
MPVEFTMPKLGLTMEEGTILEWSVPDGSDVKPGMPVLMVETDKTQTDIEVPDGGRLVQVGAVGTTYKCGEVIGWLLQPGEEPPSGAAPAATTPAANPPAALPAPAASVGTTPGASVVVPLTVSTAAPVAAGGRAFISPNARRRAGELGVDIGSVVGTGPDGRVVSEDVERAAAQPRTVVAAATAAPASSSAAQFANLVGVDLAGSGISASSPDGRISREDVANHVRDRLSSPATAGTTAAAASTGSPFTGSAATQPPTGIVAFKGMRGIIASRMHQSLQQMAQLTLTMDADMDAVVADREKRKANGISIGYTDYVIAAVARALREHPMMNAQVTPDGVATLADIHVGLAVALPGGLVVPVVKHADRLALAGLSAETTRLADAARSGKLTLPEMEGGTFSVTALGMFGVDAFTPVINPPNAGIIGVGRIRNEVEWGDDNSIRRVRRLTLSLTWDHRVLDGAPAAEFCQTVARKLQQPEQFG